MVVLDRLLETEWNAFLATLSIWEIHWISGLAFGDERTRETELHDKFVRREITLEDVEALISEAFAPRN